jgi:hypothetical protein
MKLLFIIIALLNLTITSAQNDVLQTLEKISNDELQQPLSNLENSGQLLMDCY